MHALPDSKREKTFPALSRTFPRRTSTSRGKFSVSKSRLWLATLSGQAPTHHDKQPPLQWTGPNPAVEERETVEYRFVRLLFERTANSTEVRPHHYSHRRSPARATITISANIKAYSIAVGPSSESRNCQTLEVTSFTLTRSPRWHHAPPGYDFCLLCATLFYGGN